MSVKDFQEQYWKKFDQPIVFRHKSALSLINKGRILDLGCGDGFFLELLKEKGIKGTGLEISEIAVGKAKLKGLDVQQLDFADAVLPFGDNSFETVVLLDVLEHLYKPDKILKEAYRVSKNNIVLAVPNFNSFPARVQMILGKVPENNKHKQGHVFWISFSIIKDLLKSNGFEITALSVNSFFSWLPLIKNIMQFLAEKWPSVFALNFTIKAKKK